MTKVRVIRTLAERAGLRIRPTQREIYRYSKAEAVLDFARRAYFETGAHRKETPRRRVSVARPDVAADTGGPNDPFRYYTSHEPGLDHPVLVVICKREQVLSAERDQTEPRLR